MARILRYTDGMALVFEQLFDPESSTFTYLVGDSDAKVAVLIDPVVEQVERDLARIAAHGLRLVHTVETHVHADHVTGGGLALRADRLAAGRAPRQPGHLRSAAPRPGRSPDASAR